MAIRKDADWQGLAEWLASKSSDICQANGCTEEEHNCESYAYISEDGICHDVCLCDYWRGWGERDEQTHGKLAAVPLPFEGDGNDLINLVEEWIGW